MLLSHFQVWPRYKLVNELLQSCKKEVTAHRKKFASPPMSVYPKQPTALPQPIFDHIFGDEPPLMVSIDRFNAIANAHVPLRKNSKLIKEESKTVKAEVGSPPPRARSPSS